MTDTASNGVQLSSHGAIFSDQSFIALLGWAHANPFEFFAVILLFAFGLWCRRTVRIEIARMKLEVAERRAEIRLSLGEPPLPLPPPGGN